MIRSHNSLSEMNISSYNMHNSASIFFCFLSFLMFLIRAHFLLVYLPCAAEQPIPHGKNIWLLLFYLLYKVYKVEIWKCDLDEAFLFTFHITLILQKCMFCLSDFPEEESFQLSSLTEKYELHKTRTPKFRGSHHVFSPY